MRTCAREHITTIDQAREVLRHETNRYNYRHVHSTTGEIPMVRFRKLINEGKSLFREFMIPPPYQSTKDIFCLRTERTVNAYRKISLSNLELKVPEVPIREKVQLRIVPDKESRLSEIRFWYNSKLVSVQKVKNEDLSLVHF